MCLSVFGTFLGCDQDNTVRTACAVDGRSCTIFQNVKRCNVVGVDIGQIAPGHSVDHNQRAEAC